MKTLLENISFRDDALVVWKFMIPTTLLATDSENIEHLFENIIQFYDDYIEISQIHQLGEIIPIPLIKKNDLDLKLIFRDAVTKQMETNRSLSFFPLSNAYFATNGKFSSLHPSSCKFHLQIDRKLCNDYYFINRDKISPLSKYKYNRLPYRQENFTIWGEGQKIDNLKKINIEDIDIGFSIRIYSEFWFQKTFYKSNYDYKNGFDNSFLAYHNTPRLNSFLRDLKELWIDKYEWDFLLFEEWHDTTNNGILLDNQIIYQEDIDEGRIQIPE